MNDTQELILNEPDAEAVAAARDEMTVEELDQSNEERLGRLMSGALGMPVQVQPGLFENIRLIAYLEKLLEGAGILDAANLEYAKRVAQVLDNFEGMVRMQVIKSGTGGQPLDLSAIRDAPRPNRQQRRLPPRVEPDGA